MVKNNQIVMKMKSPKSQNQGNRDTPTEVMMKYWEDETQSEHHKHSCSTTV